MEIPSYVNRAVEILHNAGFEAYAVGGCVRDSLLGKIPNDWDMCTDALPEEICKAFGDFHVIETGLKHGTVTVRIEHNSIEITTFRTDGEYLKHRKPEQVRFVKSLFEDLSRRDFTINSLAFSPTNGIIDLFCGQNDLQNKIIRCVGDPEKRFNEDALRILRALRFSSVLGFEISPETSQAVHKMKDLLLEISSERIREELLKIICGQDAFRILDEYRDVIVTVIPELRPCIGFLQHSPHHKYDVYDHIIHSVEKLENRPDLRLVMLLHDIGKPKTFTIDEKGVGHFKTHPDVSCQIAREVLNRLKFDNLTKNYVLEQISEHDNRFNADRKSVRRFVSKHDFGFLDDHLKVRKADTLAQSEYNREKKLADIEQKKTIAADLKAEGDSLQRKDLKINGTDLLNAGFKAGKDMKTILDFCLLGVVEEIFPNEKEALLSAVEEKFSYLKN